MLSYVLYYYNGIMKHQKEHSHEKLITATALFLALATASGAVPYNAADKAFSAYAVGPGLNNLSVKDGRASYQWALKMTARRKK